MSDRASLRVQQPLPALVIPRHKKLPIIELPLPVDCSIARQHDEVLETINRFRQLCLVERLRRVILDFRPIQKIGSAAALLIASEIYRWRRVRGFRPRVYGLENWNPNIVRELHEMGLFNLLEPMNPPEIQDASSSDRRFIRLFSANSAQGQLAKDLRIALEDIVGYVPSRDRLFTALTEAFANTLDHAYPLGYSHPLPILNRQWWMAGSYAPASKKLNVMFYDQGIGIPTSLPRKFLQFLPGVYERLGGNTDAHKIEASMIIKATSTGESHRGHGMEKMQRLVATSAESSLRILSGHGEYIYSSGGHTVLRNHKRNMGGTLIHWSITV